MEAPLRSTSCLGRTGPAPGGARRTTPPSSRPRLASDVEVTGAPGPQDGFGCPGSCGCYLRPLTRLSLGRRGAKTGLRQRRGVVDFLFERAHSVRNNRSSRSLMIGRRSAHSERSAPYARQANLPHRPLCAAADCTVLRDVSTCRLQANAASTPRSVCSLQARPLTFTCKPHSPSWRAIFKKWRQSAN